MDSANGKITKNFFIVDLDFCLAALFEKVAHAAAWVVLWPRLTQRKRMEDALGTMHIRASILIECLGPFRITSLRASEKASELEWE